MNLINQLRKNWEYDIEFYYPVRCYLCGKNITNVRDLTIEHLIPQALGGTDTPDNLKPAHNECNQAKNNMTELEWFYKIREVGSVEKLVRQQHRNHKQKQ